MAKRTWEVVLDNNPHLIQLDHSYWSGRREIWLDDQLIVQERKLCEFGSRYAFAIDSHKCELHITTNGFVYRYLLFIDDAPYWSHKDGTERRERDNLIQREIAVFAYWRDLARHTGLDYEPVPQSYSPYCHRVIGRIKGYMIVIRFGLEAKGYRGVVNVLMRHDTAMDLEAFQHQIKADQALQQLVGKEWVKEQEFGYSYSWVGLPYRPQKETAEQLARRIAELIDIMARYVRPLPPNWCEGPNCRNRNAPLQIVFVNQWPLLLCRECRIQVPDWGKETQQAYLKAPNSLLKGMLGGLGVAILGGLSWAVVAILFNMIAAIVGMAAFIGIVKVMDRAGTKRTTLSVGIAVGLTLLGVALGVYAVLVWETVKGSSDGVSFSTLSTAVTVAWHKLWSTRFLGQSISTCLFGVIPYSIYMWWEQRKHFSRLFRPTVETVNGR